MMKTNNDIQPKSNNQQNEVNFRDLFESLSLMFYIENFEPSYHLEYLSPEFETLGYSLDEIYSNPQILNDVMHPDDLKMMNEANKDIYNKTKLESDYEYRVYTKSGEMRWWKDRGRPIFNEKGERIKWYGVIADVTQRRIADEDLIEYKNELEKNAEELAVSYETTEAILDSIGDILIVVDDDGKIVRVNESATAITGYAEKELIGQPASILSRNENLLDKEAFEAMLRDGKLLDLETEFVCKDNSGLHVSLSSSVLRNSHKAAVIVAKDIRNRILAEENLKKYAQQLEQSNRELEDFAYVASHDLQEPLRKIQAFGDRLTRKFSGILPDEGKDYVSRMHSAAGRMQTLINDLLTFSRVSSKTQPFRSVNINVIASEVISDLEVRIEQTGATVEIGELPLIEADPVQMRQLFQNLIGNALKFHKPQEPPRIKVYSQMTNRAHLTDFSENTENVSNPKFCKIVFSDNGIGFDEKYLDKIFTVFQRLHGRENYEGSGIGLSVCRKIVERHGGEITAKSSPEIGSQFFVTLPIIQTL